MNPTLNRADRRYLDRVATRKKEFIIPKFDTSVRVVVRVDLELSFEDELMILAALEQLKKQNNQLNLEYVTTRPEIFAVLKNRWFLRASHQIIDTENLDAAFEDIVRDDFSLVVGELERGPLVEAEEAIYSANHQKVVAELEQRQRDAIERGMKDFKLPIPEYMFIPKWHKSNGYLWKIADDLGLPIKVPEKPIKPFFEIAPSREREVWRLAAKAHLTDAPFFVYDFNNHSQSMGMLEVTTRIMDGWRAVSLQEIQRAVGDNPIDVLAVMAHYNCAYAFGFVGPFLYGAWAAQVPNILAFYEGTDPRWDAVHPQNVSLLDIRAYAEEQIVAGLAPEIILLIRRANKQDKL